MKGEERTNFEVQQILPRHLLMLSSPSGLAIQKASIYGIRSKPKPVHLAGEKWTPVTSGLGRVETFRWTANNVAAANPDAYSRVMKTLNKKMQNVYAAYFVDDMTYAEIET